MTKPNLPDTTGLLLADLDRRLRALENSPRLTDASIKDGSLRVLNADGQEVARFGRLDGDFDGDGEDDWGIRLQTNPPGATPSSAHFIVTDEGWVAPSFLTPLAAPSNGLLYSTENADWTEVGRVDWIVASRDWTWDAYVNPYDGVTMSFRFLAARIGDVPHVVYEVDSAAPGQYGATWNLRDEIDEGIIGNAATIRLELRRDAGVGPASFEFLTTPVNWVAPF